MLKQHVLALGTPECLYSQASFTPSLPVAVPRPMNYWKRATGLARSTGASWRQSQFGAHTCLQSTSPWQLSTREQLNLDTNTHNVSTHSISIHIIKGSLEIKLPTICTDEKQSRAEAKRRERLEERRVEEKEQEERRCRCAKR